MRTLEAINNDNVNSVEGEFPSAKKKTLQVIILTTEASICNWFYLDWPDN